MVQQNSVLLSWRLGQANTSDVFQAIPSTARAIDSKLLDILYLHLSVLSERRETATELAVAGAQTVKGDLEVAVVAWTVPKTEGANLKNRARQDHLKAGGGQTQANPNMGPS